MPLGKNWFSPGFEPVHMSGVGVGYISESEVQLSRMAGAMVESAMKMVSG